MKVFEVKSVHSDDCTYCNYVTEGIYESKELAYEAIKQMLLNVIDEIDKKISKVDYKKKTQEVVKLCEDIAELVGSISTNVSIERIWEDFSEIVHNFNINDCNLPFQDRERSGLSIYCCSGIEIVETEVNTDLDLRNFCDIC